MKCAFKSDLIVAHKDTQIFFHMATIKQTAEVVCLLNERQPNLQLAAIDLIMIAVALTPSWFTWILTVMPVWLCFSWFLLGSILFLNTKLYMLYECYLCLIFIAVRKLTISLGVKTFETRTAHFIFSLRIFVSAHVF